jgi:polysaccharide transporter, PST family
MTAPVNESPPTSPAPNLAKSAARGAAALAAGRPIAVILTFLGTMWLARILSPRDFGVVGMVMVFLRFAEVFRDMGLGSVAIQREHLSHEQQSTLFWVNASASLLIGLLFAITGPFLAKFYDEPLVAHLAIISGVAFVLQGASVQHQASLRRSFKIGSMVFVQTVALVVGLGVAATCASMGMGARSLVLRSLAEAIVSGFRPSKPGKLGALTSELRFGAHLTLANVMAYFSRQGDNLIVGKLFGPTSLGFYTKAYELMMQPMQQVTRPLGSIALSALSRLVSQPEQYSRAYFRMMDKALLLTTPMGAACLGCPEVIIRVLLGAGWEPAAPMLRALSLVMLVQPLTSTTNWLLTSQGRGSEILRLGTATSVMNVLSFFVGALFGPLGVAWGYSLGQVVRVPTGMWYVCRTGPVAAREMYRRIAVFGSAGLGGGAVAALTAELLADKPVVLVAAACGVTTFLACGACLWLYPTGRAALRDIRKASKLAL